MRELVLRSCPTCENEDVLKIRELVEVRWDSVAGAGSDDEVVGDGSDPERSYDSGNGDGVCENFYESLSG